MPYEVHILYHICKCSEREIVTTFSKQEGKQDEPVDAVGLRPSEIATYLN
jgi:hypothetical protein